MKSIALIHFAFALSSLCAETYPPCGNVVDVTKPPYSAKADGVTDDTEALQNALNENVGRHRVLYFPNGTYLISRALTWPKKWNGKDNWGFTMLRGQQRDACVLRLKDNTFTDAKKPQTLMWCGGFGSADWFHNYVEHLTFDVGAGNPGAVALQFYSNNSGAVRDCRFIAGAGSGHTGLDLAHRDMNGPLLVRNCEVVGFRRGIATARAVNGQVFESITLRGQTEVGFVNEGQSISIRGFTSDNAVPALSTYGTLCLVDANLTGGGDVWMLGYKTERGGTLAHTLGGGHTEILGGFSYTTTAGKLAPMFVNDDSSVWAFFNEVCFDGDPFATLGGQRLLVVQTREKLAGVDPADGKVLWEQSVEAFLGMNILTPVVHQGTLFTSTYGGKTIGFKVAQADGKFTITQTWTHKSQGYMSKPVIIDGVAYEHLKRQRVMAIEVETGRELWTSGKSFGKYWGLVAQGDRILALDQRGQLLLFRANKEKFDLLDQRKLADAETWAHLAVARDQLFVPELNALAAYWWSGTTSTAAAR